MRRILAMGGTLLALTGCATPDQLAGNPPIGRWHYARDYNAVSDCLVRTMNFEFQPKSSAAQFFGRSIGHNVQILEPGKVNQVVHEHIGPSTAWMFRVTNAGANRAIAEGFVFHAHGDVPTQLSRAAQNCDPQK